MIQIFNTNFVSDKIYYNEIYEQLFKKKIYLIYFAQKIEVLKYLNLELYTIQIKYNTTKIRQM